ncbi:MAG: 50S ribosomal protein L7 [Ruminococcaceae bacterium]|nr:50S ribosomal protein L7 [Oscillospiraceae bacterium]
MEQNRSLGLLSISRKGGNIVLGEEQVGAQARANRARLVILASDAGGHTVRRAKSFVAGTAQPLITVPYTKDKLGDALGTTSCAIAAITDVRLAQAFVKTLGEPEKYAELLQELDTRVKRVEQRRAEEKAHRRNVRFGKK